MAETKATQGEINLGVAKASVTTSQGTSSTSYVQLATTTDTVTVTIGPNGVALVIISANMSQANQNAIIATSFDVSGANTIAANDVTVLNFTAYTNGASMALSGPFMLTGLTPGSTTFGMRYKVTGSPASGTWSNRTISVIPL